MPRINKKMSVSKIYALVACITLLNAGMNSFVALSDWNFCHRGELPAEERKKRTNDFNQHLAQAGFAFSMTAVWAALSASYAAREKKQKNGSDV